VGTILVIILLGPMVDLMSRQVRTFRLPAPSVVPAPVVGSECDRTGRAARSGSARDRTADPALCVRLRLIFDGAVSPEDQMSMSRLAQPSRMLPNPDASVIGCWDEIISPGSLAGTADPAQVEQQVLPPELTTMLASCSVSPVLTYHSQRVPSGPVSQVSVFWA
jgi:hypothetical protein